MYLALFLLGLILGSFINVVASRYAGNRFLLSTKVIGGRSRCPSCFATLRWFELVPLLSFVAQRGKCRTCGKRVSLRYPIVELISGCVVALIPYALRSDHMLALLVSSSSATGLLWTPYAALSVLWVLVFLTLIVVSQVDLRLRIIPDEANLFLLALGGGITALTTALPPLQRSFLGPYALLFAPPENPWMNHLAGAVLLSCFLLALVLLTRGRGMGMGDVKLGLALGFLFGWPDSLVLLAISFIVGSIAGGVLILGKRTTLKGAVPFGPFLAMGALITLLFGKEIMDAYFSLFPVL